MNSKKIYISFFVFSASLIVFGFAVSPPGDIFRGLWTIISTEDTLITDYIAVAGVGAAFVNSGLVALISTALLSLGRYPVGGTTFMDVGIMAGFAFFGKNFVNIWPIICGVWLYGKFQGEPASKYTPVALLATTLSPLVSFITLSRGLWNIPFLLLGIVVGLFIGFVLPPLAEHTYKMQNGMNLYNMGFAAGLLAMVLVSLVRAFGEAPESAYFWSAEHAGVLLIYFAILVFALIILAFVLDKGVLKEYKKLINSRGHMPNDYVEKFGVPTVLLNTALCGIIGLLYIFVSGGDLNGPTLGAVFTIMCFAGNGKNPRNILPVMGGALLGSVCSSAELSAPAVQLAGLFCTGLAPVTDTYGWFAGVLAGFLHSSAALYAGSPLAGLNLYNNGFCAGIVTIVICPIISRILMRRSAGFERKKYIDIFK